MRRRFPLHPLLQVPLIWTAALAPPVLYVLLRYYTQSGYDSASISWTCALFTLPGLLLGPVVSALGWVVRRGADSPGHWAWGTFLALSGVVLGFLAQWAGYHLLSAVAQLLGEDAMRNYEGAIWGIFLSGLYALVLPFMGAGGYFAGLSTWRWAAMAE